MGESPYLLDNRRDEAADRFDGLAALYDPVTVRHFDMLGVGEGWRCLEVGAGGGSVVRHLAGRIGPSGRVLATDIEPRFLEPLRDLGNVDVTRHDVATDPLPGAEFDLIHARLVLVHVPGRLRAISRLVRALRPGGWLLIEDGDATAPHSCLDPRTEDEILANRMRDGIAAMLEAQGLDRTFARTLPRVLRAEGLVEIAGDGYLPLSTEVRRLERANALQLQDRFLQQGIVNKEEFAHFLAMLDDPAFVLAGIPLLSTWGRARH